MDDLNRIKQDPDLYIFDQGRYNKFPKKGELNYE